MSGILAAQGGMMAKNIEVNTDTSELQKFINEVGTVAPAELSEYLIKALKKVGSADMRKLKKEQLQGGQGLNVKSKGVRNSFKSRVFGKRISDIELVEYTGWRAAELWQRGGAIRSRGRWMTVFFSGSKYADRKIYSRRQVRSLFNHNVISIVPTNGRYWIVDNENKEIIGIAKQVIRQRKRLRFFENFEDNQQKQNEILGKELERAIEQIAKKT